MDTPATNPDIHPPTPPDKPHDPQPEPHMHDLEPTPPAPTPQDRTKPEPG